MYLLQQRKYRIMCAICFALLIVVSIVSLCVGNYVVSVKDIFRLVFMNHAVSNADIKSHIVFDIRLPRILLAMIVGSALSLAGCSLQGVFQNPLVSPDILGVSSGAGFGAAVGILLFNKNLTLIYFLAFIMGILSMVFVFALSTLKRDRSILVLILCGIIVSSIFTSLVSVTKYMADKNEILPAITFWLMGSFSGVTVKEILMIFPLYFIAGVVLLFLRWKLNILSLGDEEAKLMGINPHMIRPSILAAATVLISITVTISGIIGWVGLVIPHIARQLVGSNHGYSMPFSAIAGAAFMVIVDCLARNLTLAEIPISIITALLGAPVFAVILLSKKGVE